MVKFLLKHPVSRILEVGSGPNGLGKFMAVRFVGCDENFPWAPGPHVVPVVGSALRVPFRDAAFETVLSMDMPEHIAPDQRARAVAEMVTSAGPIARSSSRRR